MTDQVSNRGVWQSAMRWEQTATVSSHSEAKRANTDDPHEKVDERGTKRADGQSISTSAMSVLYRAGRFEGMGRTRRWIVESEMVSARERAEDSEDEQSRRR